MLKEFLRSKIVAIVVFVLGLNFSGLNFSELNFSTAQAQVSCVEVLAKAENFRNLSLNFEKIFNGKNPEELRSRRFVRTLIKDLANPEYRAALEHWLLNDFARKSSDYESQDRLIVRDAIVGAGPHTLVLLAQQTQDKRNHTLVIEKNGIASSFLGKYFRMNSTQKGDLNHLPGAVIQLKDYLNISEAPLANDFGFLVLLNYKLFGIKVLLDCEVKLTEALGPSEVTAEMIKILGRSQIPKVVLELQYKNAERSRQQRRYEHSGSIEVVANRVGIATGMSIRNYRYLEGLISSEARQILKNAELGKSLQETHGVTVGDNFLRQVKDVLDGKANRALEGASRFVIAGAKHEAFTVAEGILALIKAKKISPETKIIIQGLKSRRSADFAQEVIPPKGSDAFKAMIRDRYVGQGIPEAIDRGTILVDFESTSHVRSFETIQGYNPNPNRWDQRPAGLVKVFTAGESNGHSHLVSTDADILVFATGYLRDEVGLPAETKRDFADDEYYRFSSELIRSPSWYDPVGSGIFWYDQIRKTRYLIAYSFGVAPKLPISADRLQGPIGNPDALYVTLPATAELGKMVGVH